LTLGEQSKLISSKSASFWVCFGVKRLVQQNSICNFERTEQLVYLENHAL